MLVIAAMLVGAIVPVQTAINTRFRESIGSPIVAGFFSFIIGLAVSALFTLTLTGNLMPDLATAVSYTHLTLPTIAAECRSRWSPYH